MAHAGQVLKTGSLTLTFRRCDDDCLEMVALYPPGGPMPPEHYHPVQTERFEVLAGVLEVVLEGERFTLEAGQVLEIRPMQRHQMWNAGEEEAKVRWETWPAQRTAEFFETLAELSEEGKPLTSGSPPLLQMAVLMAEYDAELRLTRPSRLIQRALIGVMAPMGWLLGYRSRPRQEEGVEALDS